MTLDSDIKPVPRPLADGVDAVPRDFVERLVGHRLPAALADLLDGKGNATGFAKGVEIRPSDANPVAGKRMRLSVQTLFGLNTGPDGLLAYLDRFRDRIGRDVVPFAEDGMGNLFLWEPETGAVLFWYHECPQGEASAEARSAVAGSMKAFVSGLAPVSEPNRAELKRGVKSARLDIF